MLKSINNIMDYIMDYVEITIFIKILEEMDYAETYRNFDEDVKQTIGWDIGGTYKYYQFLVKNSGLRITYNLKDEGKHLRIRTAFYLKLDPLVKKLCTMLNYNFRSAPSSDLEECKYITIIDISVMSEEVFLPVIKNILIQNFI